MAKKDNKSEQATGEGGLPPELMVDATITPDPQPDNNGDDTTSEQLSDPESSDPESDDTKTKGELDQKPDQDFDSDGIYIVVKGRSVQHNGILYRENQQIELDDADADRLIGFGVVMTLEAVRDKLAKANPPGTVTINGR